jgi:hypothetical protein
MVRTTFCAAASCIWPFAQSLVLTFDILGLAGRFFIGLLLLDKCYGGTQEYGSSYSSGEHSERYPETFDPGDGVEDTAEHRKDNQPSD